MGVGVQVRLVLPDLRGASEGQALAGTALSHSLILLNLPGACVCVCVCVCGSSLWLVLPDLRGASEGQALAGTALSHSLTLLNLPGDVWGWGFKSD